MIAVLVLQRSFVPFQKNKIKKKKKLKNAKFIKFRTFKQVYQENPINYWVRGRAKRGHEDPQERQEKKENSRNRKRK